MLIDLFAVVFHTLPPSSIQHQAGGRVVKASFCCVLACCHRCSVQPSGLNHAKREIKKVLQVTNFYLQLLFLFKLLLPSFTKRSLNLLSFSKQIFHCMLFSFKLTLNIIYIYTTLSYLHIYEVISIAIVSLSIPLQSADPGLMAHAV